MATTSKDDLAAKVAHEKRLLGAARSLAASLAQRVRSSLASGSSPALEGPGLEVLVPTLADHYAKVAADFSHDMADELPEGMKPTPAELDRIDAALDEAFKARATGTADIVMTNAQATAVRSVIRAKAEVEASDTMSTSDIPTLASNMFLTVQRARAASMACTETQWAAERSKGIEVQVLIGEEDGEAKADVEAFKVWRSQGDSRVRTASTGGFDHLSPDGQKVPTNEVFTVSGQRLRWPGDVALGASLGNIIGCRCSAIYDAPSVAAVREVFLENQVPAEPTDPKKPGKLREVRVGFVFSEMTPSNASLRDAVQAAIEDYVSGLGDGDDVMESAVRSAILGATTSEDLAVDTFQLLTPSGNVDILKGQIAVIGDVIFLVTDSEIVLDDPDPFPLTESELVESIVFQDVDN